jgi:hypothetical protein
MGTRAAQGGSRRGDCDKRIACNAHRMEWSAARAVAIRSDRAEKVHPREAQGTR